MPKTITVNDQEFIMIGQTTRGGAVLEENYFATDGSKVKVTIDYHYTDKGSK